MPYSQYVYGPALDAPDKTYILMAHVNNQVYILNYDPGLNPGYDKSIDVPYFGLLEQTPIGSYILFKLNQEDNSYQLTTISTSSQSSSDTFSALSSYPSFAMISNNEGYTSLIPASQSSGEFEYQYMNNSSSEIDLYVGYNLTLLVKDIQLRFKVKTPSIEETDIDNYNENPSDYIPNYVDEEVTFIFMVPINTYINIDCSTTVTNYTLYAYAGNSKYTTNLYYTNKDWCNSSLKPKLCDNNVNCGATDNCVGPCYGTNPICGVDPYKKRIQCIPYGGVKEPWYKTTWFKIVISILIFGSIIALIVFLLSYSSKQRKRTTYEVIETEEEVEEAIKPTLEVVI